MWPSIRVSVLLSFAFLLLFSFPSVISAAVIEPKPSANRTTIRRPNWSSFRTLSHANFTSSRDFILSFPVYHFWDTLKGHFRTGVIGEEVAKQHPTLPHLTAKVDKRIYHAGQMHQISQQVVDTSYVYMHMLVSIQYIIHLYETMNIALEMYLTSTSLQFNEHVNSAEGSLAGKGSELSITNLTSIADLTASKQILTLQEEILHSQLQQLEEISRHDVEIVHWQGAERQAARLDLHHRLLEGIQHLQQHITHLQTNQLQAIDALIQAEEEQIIAMMEEEHQRDLQVDIQQLEAEIAMSLQLIAFQFEEEQTLLQDIEARELRLIHLKHESYRQYTEEFFQVMSEEVVQMTWQFFQDPQSVYVWLRNILLAIVAIITLLETSYNVHIIYQRYYQQSRQLYSQSKRSRSWWQYLWRSSGRSELTAFLQAQTSTSTLTTAGSISKHLENHLPKLYEELSKHRMLYRTEVVLTLIRVYCQLHTALMSNVRTEVMMPHILLHGLPGCGKSETCQVILDAFPNMPFVKLSAADILSLGNQANHYLKELFENILRSRCPTLVIIEEADSIIYSRQMLKLRGSDKLQNGAGNVVNHCLFALLESLRVNNPYYSLVLTTRLSLEEVDHALLDRMDHLMAFHMPESRLRLFYLVEHVDLEFDRLLVPSVRQELTSLQGLLRDKKYNTNITTSESDEDALETLLTSVVLPEDVQLDDFEAYFNHVFFPSNDELRSTAGGNGKRASLTSTSKAGAVTTGKGRRGRLSTSAPEVNPEDSHYQPNQPDPQQIKQLQQRLAHALVFYLQDHIQDFSTDHFDLNLCLKAMILKSWTWSYRDLQKKLMNIKYSILCSER